MAADDSPLALTLLSRLLRGEGYRVVTAANGIEAAQMAYQQAPDLIVLDIEMPRLNGYQVCRLLKRDATTSQIPVIILTAVETRGTEFWSLRTGADAFVVKRSEPAELMSRIQALLRQTPPSPTPLRIATTPPSAEEILSNVCALVDEELYATTIERIELKTILQNLQDGVLTLNLAGEVTAANQALCMMLGQDESEVVGRPLAGALGKAVGATPACDWNSPASDAVLSEIETTVSHPSGRSTPVTISIVPLRDFLGATVGCVCLFQDITRRKEIETLVTQMQALDKVKNDLTHMIVHDLRTPLTSLLAGLQSIRPAEEDREILDISVAGGNSLLGMINDLLDISKMEEGLLSLERSTFDLDVLVLEAFQQVKWLAEDKNIHLGTDLSPSIGPVNADGEKLRRVFVNLLGNAVKFTPPDGRITVSAVLDSEKREIVFGIRDTGEGIPKEAFGRIFEKFGQVETRRAGKTKSTGLGLTFCKLAVEAHGGRIWVESEPGLGSTFFFTLPT